MRRSRKNINGPSVLGFLVLFTSVWMLLIGGFDAFIAWSVWKQIKATGFTAVPAAVISSEVESDSSGDGTTYQAVIVYRYQVGGHTYESDRVMYGMWSSSDSSDATRFVREFPEGAQITAYHDPGDPAEAVLVRGMQSQQYFMIMFILPFNAVGFGMGYAALSMLLYHRNHPRGGLGIRRDGMVTRVKLSRWSPVYAFIGGVGITSFFSVFVVAFIMSGVDAAPRIGIAASAAVGVIASVAAIVRNFIRGTAHDLLIDRQAGTVTLPARKKRRPEPVTIPMASIRGIGMNASTDESNSTVNDEKVVMHTPTIVYDAVPVGEATGGGTGHDGPGDRTGEQTGEQTGKAIVRARVVNWSDRRRSDKLASWLAMELGVPMLPGHPPSSGGTDWLDITLDGPTQPGVDLP